MSLSLSPARTPGQLQRQPSCKTRPLLAQDSASLLCQSWAALPRSPRGLGCDKHPVSPPARGPPLCWGQHTRSSPSAAAAAATPATKSSHRSHLKTSNPRAPAAHPDLSGSSVISIPSSSCSASHFRERRKHKPTPSSLTDLSSAGSHLRGQQRWVMLQLPEALPAPNPSPEGFFFVRSDVAGSSDPLGASRGLKRQPRSATSSRSLARCGDRSSLPHLPATILPLLDDALQHTQCSYVNI